MAQSERLENLDEVVTAMLLLRNAEELKSFLKDILTTAEQDTVVLRWKVAKMLDEGTPYKQIEKLTGASSATIAKVSEFLKYGYNGYRLTLDRVNNKK